MFPLTKFRKEKKHLFPLTASMLFVVVLEKTKLMNEKANFEEKKIQFFTVQDL